MDKENYQTNKNSGLLRQSLLNWYEFDRDSRILLAGEEAAAMSNLFSDRCGQVEIMRFSGQTSETAADELLREPYDYIVALGELEGAKDPAALLKKWMHCLKPAGHLLVTVENRYGLKYFCGAEDPCTGLPFDGINGYLRGSKGKGRCYSRKEVLAWIKRAGICRYQFYYPVPDSRMPQMIFSDRYQKGINTAERLVDYNYMDSAMYGVEHRIFCEMIDDGALPFMANSFLLELTNEGSLSDIIYAVTTTDRGELYGTATTIRESGMVKKRPLWKDGAANIRRIHRYTEELFARGIPVVRTGFEEDAFGPVLTMPYIDEEGLSPVMKRLAEEDPQKFVMFFDQIYDYIKRASDWVPGEENDGINKSDGININEEDPILKRAYLDLAPCNCFYRKETDSLLFYDQEFAMENCPAGFAMFRTLKYCYASAGVMDTFVPIRTMYERYGFSEDMIKMYEQKEAAFIQSIRNTERYAGILQGATPDYEKIYRKMEAIAALSVTEETEKETDVQTSDRKQKPYHTGYVPGVFDLFHTGHLNLLERCKSRCDYLIAGVLTDELVEYYKGRKTVIPYEDRARVIGALKVVDEVIPVDFSNTDKLDAWEQLHYDCHFSGDDHAGHWNDVWEELKKRGSDMEFFPYTQGISTTKIKEDINS